MSKPFYNVSPAQFVKAWEKATTVADVQRITGLPISAIYSRASHYRKKGVVLRRLQRPKTGFDVSALNVLVKSKPKK